MTFVQASVTCKDAAEAQKIADALLGQRLIACAKIVAPIESTYWWKGALQKNSETLLVMDTHESRCAKIEEMLASLHSYEAFVFSAVPMVYVSKAARVWLQESLNLLGL